MESSIDHAFDSYQKIAKRLKETMPYATYEDVYRMNVLVGLEEICFMLSDIMAAIEDK